MLCSVPRRLISARNAREERLIVLHETMRLLLRLLCESLHMNSEWRTDHQKCVGTSYIGIILLPLPLGKDISAVSHRMSEF